MKYQPPYGPNWPNVADPNASYVNGNPSAGIAGSIPPAQAFEYPMREITNLISKGGFVPDDGDLFQMTRGVRRALFAWGVDTGSTNSMSVSLDPPLTSYASGLELRILVANDNTSATTIRVSGLSTQQIIKKDGSTLVPGDLKRGGISVLVYDGANFQLVSGAAGSTTITGGWFNGADYMVDTGTPNHIVGIPVVAPSSYSAGLSYLVLIGNANTGPCDINVNNLGVKPLRTPKLQEFASGDIIPGMLMRVSYDGTQFVMLSPINMAIIETNVSFIVGPNAGADFADLQIALNWAMRRKFDENGSMTMQLQNQSSGGPLLHTYNKNVIFDHPQGDRIFVLGGALNGGPPTGPATVTQNIRSDAAANLTAWRASFRCELHFNAGFGIQIRKHLGLLQNVLITGAGIDAGTAQTGIFVTVGASLNIDTVAVCMFSLSTWYLHSGEVVGRNFYSSGAQQYVIIEHESKVNIGPVLVPLPWWPGNITIGTGTIYFLVLCSVNDGMCITYGSAVTLNATQPRVYDHGATAVNMWGGSSLNCPGLMIGYCGSYGLFVSGSTAAVGTGSAYTCSYGYYAYLNGGIDATSTNTGGITYADYLAANGANINANSHQNASAQFTPTLNTVGNGAAFISG